MKNLAVSGWYAEAGPAFHLLNVPYALSFVSVTILWRKRKRLPPGQRFRLSSIIGAQVLIFALGLNDLLPIVKEYYYPFTHVPVYPYGSLAAVFYGMIVRTASCIISCSTCTSRSAGMRRTSSGLPSCSSPRPGFCSWCNWPRILR